jgi:hypothetical protein
MDLVIDSSPTGWMTGHRTVAVHRADRVVTGSLAVVARDDAGSEERHGEDRVLSKIKGGGSRLAAFFGLHIGWRGTRQNARIAVRSWDCECSQSFVASRLRWPTIDPSGAVP